MKNLHAFLGGIVLGALLLGGIWLLVGSGHQATPGSQTVNYSNSLSQANLYNELNSIVNDIANVRASVAGLNVSSTASITFPNLTTSTNGIATTTQIAGLAGSLGDEVIVEPATVQPIGATFLGTVVTASTTSATFQITAIGASSTVISPVASAFNVYVFTKANFVTPPALNTVTSTSN